MFGPDVDAFLMSDDDDEPPPPLMYDFEEETGDSFRQEPLRWNDKEIAYNGIFGRDWEKH